MGKINDNKLLDSKWFPFLLFIVSFVFVTLFSRSTSFLYAFEGADPSIFKQMGRAVLKGKIMYIDYFDNKGCLLYFIHALGPWLGGNTALMLMQTLSLTTALLLWNKIITLYRNSKQCLKLLMLSLFVLLCCYGAGDQSQEWCLPFISYPLLVFCRSHKEKTTIQPFQMGLIGGCFGVITFIQINNACAFLGFVSCFWIHYLLKKEFKTLFQSTSCFLVGWLVIAIPCLLYFYFKAGWNGINEMVYGSFLSNLEYIGSQKTGKWFHSLPYIVFLVLFLNLVVISFFKKKDLLIASIVSTLLFIATYGRFCNSFYLIALLPLCVVIMTLFDFKMFKIIKLSMVSLLCITLLFMGSIIAYHFINDLLLRNEKEVTIYKDFHQCVDNIPKNERDSIYNYNLNWYGTTLMEHEGLLQCNRVLYPYLVFKLPTLQQQEMSKPVHAPKWILLSPNMFIQKEDAYFIMKNYELCYSFDYNNQLLKKSNVGDNLEICFYHRKN